MSFRDFSYPTVIGALGLTEDNSPLFPEPTAVPLRPELAETLAFAVRRYSASASEKARSEFLIAPLMLELQRRFADRLVVFSGVELSADPAKGLNGICDFVLTRGRAVFHVTDPIIAVAEAKPDQPVTGFGQCIAGMRAAWLLNERAKRPIPAVYGVSTTGVQWMFLRLIDTAVTIDPAEYFINQPERVLGVLSHIIELATA
ncbi:MAG: hypothetical protein ACRC7O_06385 [Fimbriiglobus sp.]